MRALTMDEVGCVSGGARGIFPTYDSNGMATLTNSGAGRSGVPFTLQMTCVAYSDAPVNGGFATQDAQLQCYADWVEAGYPDIAGQSKGSALSDGLAEANKAAAAIIAAGIWAEYGATAVGWAGLAAEGALVTAAGPAILLIMAAGLAGYYYSNN